MKPQTVMPAMPSGDHVPEFITNMPDPKTGQPLPNEDGDIHGTVFATYDNYVSTDVVIQGDRGRISKP